MLINNRWNNVHEAVVRGKAIVDNKVIDSRMKKKSNAMDERIDHIGYIKLI